MDQSRKEPKGNKLSYESLEALASQLSAENRQLSFNIKKINNIMSRLTYLMEVHKYPNGFSEEFVKSCNKEIESLLSLPEEEKQ